MIPPPRRGGSQDHRCDDNGRQYTRGNTLYTCCSKCGRVVATDQVPEDDEEED